VFILVQCNTSLSKNYVAHSVTIVCVIGSITEKKVCLHSGSLRILNQPQNKDISIKKAFDNKELKTFLEFRIW